MQTYPLQSHAKFLVKPQENSFDVRKTTNIGNEAIYHQIFYLTVLEKLFHGLM